MYRHPQASPNDPVTLHQGPVTLQHTKGTAQGTGTLVLRWFPTTGLRLECDVAAPEPGEQVKAAIAGGVADVLVSAVQMDVKSGVMSVTSSGRVKSFETGTGTVLASIGFQVLNFSDFLTPGPRPAPVFGYPPHIADLDYDIWRVRLTAVEDSTALFKNLNQIGGYAFTHLARIIHQRRKKRLTEPGFTTKDAVTGCWEVCAAEIGRWEVKNGVFGTQHSRRQLRNRVFGPSWAAKWGEVCPRRARRSLAQGMRS